MAVGMLKKQVVLITTIRVPVKRAKTLDADKVRQIVESILEEGQRTLVLVRADGDRCVLVEGLHRLEALKALGEKTIEGYLVQASKALTRPSKADPICGTACTARQSRSECLRQTITPRG